MSDPKDIVQQVLSDQIDLPVIQMRKDIDRDELHELAESIKEKGLISPITVRPIGERFELVAGQRRLLACRIAGIIRIKCVVRELSDADALAIMAAENIDRRDVNIVDEANFISLVMESTKVDPEAMAARLNRGKQYVLDRLIIAEMPDYMQAFLKSGELKIGAALALMEIEPDEKRRLWVGLAVQDNASVRTVEYWAYQHRLGTLPGAIASDSDVPVAPGSEYRPAMLTCAVDGKEYIATECQAVFVYRGNIGFIEALRAEMSKPELVLSEAGGEESIHAP